MRLFVDTTPLRVSRDFRRLWIGPGGLVLRQRRSRPPRSPIRCSTRRARRSPSGCSASCSSCRCCLFSLVGGAFADGVDKRRLLLARHRASRWRARSRSRSTRRSIIRRSGCCICSWARQRARRSRSSFPVLRSLLPILVDDELRPAAFALQSTYGSFGMMAGPAVGGLLIGRRRAHERVRGRRRDVRDRARRVLRASRRRRRSGGRSASRVVDPGRAALPARPFRHHEHRSASTSSRWCSACRARCSRRSPSGSVAAPELYGLLLSSVAAGAFVASLVERLDDVASTHKAEPCCGRHGVGHRPSPSPA